MDVGASGKRNIWLDPSVKLNDPNLSSYFIFWVAIRFLWDWGASPIPTNKDQRLDWLLIMGRNAEPSERALSSDLPLFSAQPNFSKATISLSALNLRAILYVILFSLLCFSVISGTICTSKSLVDFISDKFLATNFSFKSIEYYPCWSRFILLIPFFVHFHCITLFSFWYDCWGNLFH